MFGIKFCPVCGVSMDVPSGGCGGTLTFCVYCGKQHSGARRVGIPTPVSIIPTSELESLRADCARLDWLINELDLDGIGDRDLREIACGIAGEAMDDPDESALERAYLKAVRVVIDAAIEEEK